MKKRAIVLVAGKGTRMRTDLPKCAYPILGKPMIMYITKNIEESLIDESVLIVGHKKEIFYDLLEDNVKYVTQKEQLGTGHAVKVASDLLKDEEGTTIIMLGDMPLVNTQIIDDAINYHSDSAHDLTVLTTFFDCPKGYGRIIRNEYGNITSITEERDASLEQKQIKEINTGIYVVDNKLLFETVNKIEKNPLKGEYYLTDIVSILKNEDKSVGTYIIEDNTLVMGINDLYNVSVAEAYLRNEINKSHMLNGVYIINPSTVTIGEDVEIEPDVRIFPNTTITGTTLIKSGSKVGPNTELHNAYIGNNVTVKHSYVMDSKVLEGTTVGPFAHIRQHAIIGPYNRIGNFVEVKKSQTGDHTKAAHLTYIGDTEAGSNVNFGCGTVTVNYDGVMKHKTVIGDDVFIGCNTNLIAPLKVEDNVFIAAGSTVTVDIPKGAFAIARNRQINKTDYAKNLIQAEKKKK